MLTKIRSKISGARREAPRAFTEEGRGRGGESLIRLTAACFDTMATAPWAVDPFRMEDWRKIARLLTTAELRPGVSVLEPGCAPTASPRSCRT